MAKKKIPYLPNYVIENVVSSINLNVDLDLAKIAETYPEMCKYQPWRFPGAIIKLPPDEKLGNVTFLLFRKGNINCTGAKDHRHLYDKCYKKLFEMLKKVDPNIPEIKPEDIVIQNIVATGRFEREIDLYNLALNEENVRYEPEIFPGANISFGNFSARIFRNGKVVITGAKSEEQIKELAKKVYEIGKKYLIK